MSNADLRTSKSHDHEKAGDNAAPDRPKNRPVDEGRPKLQVRQDRLEMRFADVLVGDGVDCSRSVK